MRVWPIGAASIGSKGEALAEIAAMKNAGIVAVSDDGKPVATARLMRQVMDYCNSLGLPVIDHCEDPSLFAGGVMREGQAVGPAGAQGHARAIGIDLRGARRGGCAAYGSAAAHRAYVHARFARICARWPRSKVCASLAK